MPSSHLAGAWLAHKNRYKNETPAEKKARIKERLNRTDIKNRYKRERTPEQNKELAQFIKQRKRDLLTKEHMKRFPKHPR